MCLIGDQEMILPIRILHFPNYLFAEAENRIKFVPICFAYLLRKFLFGILCVFVRTPLTLINMIQKFTTKISINDERSLDCDVKARSEEHTSELQSLMRISYAVFCLKKKNILHNNHIPSLITVTYNNNTY